MLGWLRRLVCPNNDLVLAFGTAEGAFSYICKYMECSVSVGSELPCLVLDARIELGADTPVIKQSNGNQRVALRVPSEDGGFVVMAETAWANCPPLEPGQLVGWRAMGYVTEVGDGIVRAGGDRRSGWCGFIVATLKPNWSRGCWQIEDKFVR